MTKMTRRIGIIFIAVIALSYVFMKMGIARSVQLQSAGKDLDTVKLQQIDLSNSLKNASNVHERNTLNNLSDKHRSNTLKNPAEVHRSNTRKNPTEVHRSNSLKNQNNTDHLLNIFSKYADANRTIMVSLLDHHYIDIALNLYYSSYKRLNITNYMFFSSDNNSCPHLLLRGVNCQIIPADIDIGEDTGYNTKKFKHKTNIKLKIVRDLLEMNYNVLLVDLDIVMLKNPLDYLYCEECDLEIQFDTESELNSGFYLAKSTKNCVEAFQDMWKIVTQGNTKEQIPDQGILNRVVKQRASKNMLKFKVLNQSIFPNGHAYYFKKKVMFAKDLPTDEIIVHNNWILSQAAKIYRFKETSMWFYDKNKYYTNTTRKYLIYNNPLNHDQLADIHDVETSALKAALAIGYLLNRTVILPHFTCKGCKHHEGACANSNQQCSLNAHYHLQTFDKHFGDSYREHMFLQNKLVPMQIKESTSKTLIIQTHFVMTKFNMTKWKTNSTIVHFKPRTADIVTPDEIKAWCEPYKQFQVLDFHSLYGVNITLPTTPQYSDINNKLKYGIKVSDYMQFLNRY